jgi:hypothetical protein
VITKAGLMGANSKDLLENSRSCIIGLSLLRALLPRLGIMTLSKSIKGSFLHLLMPFYANVFEGIDKISDTVEDVQAPLLKRFSQMSFSSHSQWFLY